MLPAVGLRLLGAGGEPLADEDGEIDDVDQAALVDVGAGLYGVAADLEHAIIAIEIEFFVANHPRGGFAGAAGQWAAGRYSQDAIVGAGHVCQLTVGAAGPLDAVGYVEEAIDGEVTGGQLGERGLAGAG